MNSLYDRVRECSVHFEAIVARIAAAHGLTNAQLNALRVLDEGPGLRMSELAARILCDDSTTTRVVSALGETRLVVRRSDERDRRVRRVALTAAGRTMLARCEDALEARIRSIQKRVGEERVEATSTGLAALIAHLEDANGGRGE